MNELLPIGSIVLLEKTNKPVMIYGFNQIHRKTGKFYDYIACLYPEGSLDNEYSLLFWHSQIDKVLHKGCVLDIPEFQSEVVRNVASPSPQKGMTLGEVDDFI